MVSITITQDAVVDTRELSTELETALVSFLPSQVFPGQNGPFASIGDLMIYILKENLFTRVVAQFPPKSVSDAQASVETAKASVEAAKETVLLSTAKLDVTPTPSAVEILR